MAKVKTRSVTLDFAFFTHLHNFYKQNRKHIRSKYNDLTRKYLDYNDPQNAKAFLRQPQFEALEIYIFLKEFLDNASLHHIFRDWADQTGHFAGRNKAAKAGQLGLFEEPTKGQYDEVFNRLRANSRNYPNYIFALTMGTGKTILMATCIFYEFLLAKKYPADERYCHNALVFAPDKTVLESLREIQTFDLGKVVPPEYAERLRADLKFHFLDESGMTLSTIDASRFNLIISNTQKIILKRQHTEKNATEKLFGSGKQNYVPGNVYAAASDLYELEPEDETGLIQNQRFEKIRRLGQLGIYVDEAHHAFGTNLAKDVGSEKDSRSTSLRNTIDELAAELKKAGTRVVACFNYTGTPYVGREVLPEVVYAFGLQEAIDKQFLKKVKLNGYTNSRNEEFVALAIADFIAQTQQQRHEEMLPKMAFFAATIEELENELRPAVEKALLQHNLPLHKILVNVGDEKLTKNDDIREFNRLDSPASDKQFILLVNKGREGWNCRSLFGVALFRQPKSKIFVLQATMRCLRSIGEGQQTGLVYLSQDNLQILNDELQQNFHVTVEEIQQANSDKELVQVIVAKSIKVKLHRIRKQFELKDKTPPPSYSLGLAEVNLEPYRLLHVQQEGLTLGDAAKRHQKVKDISAQRQRREFSPLTLVAEIARYLNLPCLTVNDLLGQTTEGMESILAQVNQFNELLYDYIIPRLFETLYELTPSQTTEEYEVDLVKQPPLGYYQLSADPKLIARPETDPHQAHKSFHLNPYCFDSKPEQTLFWQLLRDGLVKELYFTGMLTHGQTDFFVQYIDPESNTVRSYYPDFLLKRQDDTYVIVEVKGDNKIDDPVVQAKKRFAEQMAQASGMLYHIIKGSDANKGNYRFLLTNDYPYQAELTTEE